LEEEVRINVTALWTYSRPNQRMYK
jgi:hypothetical protein